jgi:hypothetical protein
MGCVTDCPHKLFYARAAANARDRPDARKRVPRKEISRMRIEPVFLFDPDGTLVDSVYMFSP